jgi:hypothetical protein
MPVQCHPPCSDLGPEHHVGDRPVVLRCILPLTVRPPALGTTFFVTPIRARDRDADAASFERDDVVAISG